MILASHNPVMTKVASILFSSRRIAAKPMANLLATAWNKSRGFTVRRAAFEHKHGSTPQQSHGGGNPRIRTQPLNVEHSIAMHSHGQWPIYRTFTYQTYWCSIYIPRGCNCTTLEFHKEHSNMLGLHVRSLGGSQVVVNVRTS